MYSYLFPLSHAFQRSTLEINIMHRISKIDLENGKEIAAFFLRSIIIENMKISGQFIQGNQSSSFGVHSGQ